NDSCAVGQRFHGEQLVSVGFRYCRKSLDRRIEVPLAAGPENRVLVYDVGGSHISAAVFDGQSCGLAGLVSASYPSEQTTDTFLNVLHSLGALATQDVTGVHGACLAMPGPFDYDAGVSWMEHKLPYLYGFDLRGALARHLG